MNKLELKRKLNKHAIYIKTEEERKKLFAYLDDLGFTWASGHRLLYRSYGVGICVDLGFFEHQKGLMQSGSDWYINNGYKVITVNEFFYKFTNKGVYL